MNSLIKTFCWIFFFIGVSQSYCQYQTNATEKDSLLVLKNGSIIRLTSEGSSMNKGTIVIENEKIIEVNYKDLTKVYPNAETIDLQGKYLLPGLIDSHVHLATVPKTNRYENNEFMEKQLDEMLYSGITSVRDMTGNGIILADYTRASRLNHIPAPEIFYAAQFAGPEYFKEMRSYASQSESKTDSPWEQTITDTTNVELAIARAKGAGVTGIKIYAELTPQLVAKITKEAHAQGLKAWSHSAVFPASPYVIAETKVNTMSHAWDIMYGLNDDYNITRSSLSEEINYKQLDRLLLLMKKNNIILDATNYIAENNYMTNGVKITKRAHELGVKISVGTDWPYAYESEIPLFKEMRLLIDKCGFTNAQVLYSATKIGAESIGVADRGVLEPSKRADILITNKNPLEDIENIKEHYITIKSGIIYKKRNL